MDLKIINLVVQKDSIKISSLQKIRLYFYEVNPLTRLDVYIRQRYKFEILVMKT